MGVLEIASLVGLLLALLAALFDWRRGEIPNWLTLPPLAIAPLAYGLCFGPWEAARSLLGAVACGLVPYLMFRAGAGGGGDVKLLAALGAVLGLSLGLEIELWGFLVAAVFALGRLAWEGRLFRTLGNALFLGLNPVLPRKWRREITPELMSTIRMGVPIFVASLVAVALHNPVWWA